MDKKIISVIAVVAILVVAAVGVYLVIGGDDDDNGTPTDLANAELKVYGNINGDRYLDESDIALIQDLIDDGYTAEDYPLADANQDGVLDSKDIAVIQNVIDGEQTVIWHINYHDTDGDGYMDEELVSTTYPVSSVICTGSTNTFLILMMLGIVDEVKGSSYSSADSALFGSTYLDTSKVERLGTSSTTIAFEDGKAGSSDIIATEGVTAVISDWNRTYITNESDFESAGVDVIRVAAASTDRDVMTHTAALLCLLFQKGDRVDTYLDLCFDVMDYVEGAIEGEESPGAVASSMTGYISSEGSDYTAVVLAAGSVFGLDGVDFGGSTSIKIVDHPEVYTYDFEYIIHLRTGLSYSQTSESNASTWSTCTSPFSDWQYAESGQYVVSGTVPVPLRIAYSACALHSDVVDVDTIDAYHQQFVDLLYGGLQFDISSMSFLLTPEDMSS